MKAVLLPIYPRHCENIASGKKTIEVRKTAPKLPTPFKCYIYMTEKEFVARKEDGDWWFNVRESLIKPIGSVELSGKVIGEFVCDEIYEWKYECDGVDIDDETLLDTKLEWEEINIYAHGKTLYGWRISDLKIYDKPKELGEFIRPCEWRHRIEDEDCECLLPRPKKKCQYECADKNPDGSVNIFTCGLREPITRPPQSWCYVEEL